MTMRYLYIGLGAFLPGVPARDLGADEWEALAEEQRALALDLDLYQPIEDGADGRAEAGFLGRDAGELAATGDGGEGIPRARHGRKREAVPGPDASVDLADGGRGGTADGDTSE